MMETGSIENKGLKNQMKGRCHNNEVWRGVDQGRWTHCPHWMGLKSSTSQQWKAQRPVLPPGHVHNAEGRQGEERGLREPGVGERGQKISAWSVTT